MGSLSVTMDNRYRIDSSEISLQNIKGKKMAVHAQKTWQDKLLESRLQNYLVSKWVSRARLIEPLK